jgi:hypothetical protein
MAVAGRDVTPVRACVVAFGAAAMATCELVVAGGVTVAAASACGSAGRAAVGAAGGRDVATAPGLLAAVPGAAAEARDGQARCIGGLEAGEQPPSLRVVSVGFCEPRDTHDLVDGAVEPAAGLGLTGSRQKYGCI